MSPQQNLCLQDTQMGCGEQEESTTTREGSVDLLSAIETSNLLTKMRQLPIKAVIVAKRM